MCDCREAVDRRLAFVNARIASGFVANFDDGPTRGMELAPPMIVLEKIDNKKRSSLPTLLASCCPFCGERYAEAASTEKALDVVERDFGGVG